MPLVPTERAGVRYGSEYGCSLIDSRRKEILSETYIPDASGRITINDLQGLIEPYLATNLIERCSYRITDGSSEQNKNFTVQFCAAESSMPAADFMAGYFCPR